MNIIKKYLQNKIISAFHDSENAISDIIYTFSAGKKLKLLDVGCGSGKLTNKLIKEALGVSSFEVHGVDILNECCIEDNIVYHKSDLTDKLPFDNDSFDIIIANQIIEHLLDKDYFLSECYRVLKMGGIFICCTDNISSWDNIISLLLGQEPLSQHTGSKFVTNSFLSPYFMKKIDNKVGNFYLHKNVCSYYGLQRLLKIAAFKDLNVKTFGNLCKFFEFLFPQYNRIIFVSCIK